MTYLLHQSLRDIIINDGVFLLINRKFFLRLIICIIVVLVERIYMVIYKFTFDYLHDSSSFTYVRKIKWKEFGHCMQCMIHRL